MPYRIRTFSTRDVTTVLYICINLAYCFLALKKNPIEIETTTTTQGIRAHIRDHVLSLT